MTPEGMEPAVLDLLVQEAERQLAYPPIHDDEVLRLAEHDHPPDGAGDDPRILLVFLHEQTAKTVRIEVGDHAGADVAAILATTLDLPYLPDEILVWYRDPRRSHRRLFRDCLNLVLGFRAVVRFIPISKFVIENGKGEPLRLDRLPPTPTDPLDFDRYFTKTQGDDSAWAYLTQAQREVMRALLAEPNIASGNSFWVDGREVEPPIGRKIQPQTLNALRRLGLIERAGDVDQFRLTKAALIGVESGERP